MNRRKYLLSTIGIGTGIGVISKYNTKESIAVNSNLPNSVSAPDTIQENNSYLNIKFTKFELQPKNIRSY